MLFAAAAPKYLVIVFVVSVSVFELLALALDFFLSGFLTSLLVAVALNFGGFALKKMRGFLEKIGKKFDVEGIEVKFAVLDSSSAVWVSGSGLSSSVSSGSFPLGLFRESLSSTKSGIGD